VDLEAGRLPRFTWLQVNTATTAAATAAAATAAAAAPVTTPAAAPAAAPAAVAAAIAAAATSTFRVNAVCSFPRGVVSCDKSELARCDGRPHWQSKGELASYDGMPHRQSSARAKGELKRDGGWELKRRHGEDTRRHAVTLKTPNSSYLLKFSKVSCA
jgi:hypothetical protein